MADRASWDVNNQPTLLAVSTADGKTPVLLEADPNTHGLVISAALTLSGTALPVAGAATAIAVALVDSSGNQVSSFGGGTQYTDAGAPPGHPVGPTLLWSDGSNWQTVSTAKPLPITVVGTPTVTANAGTNLNTSLLALEAGGNLAAIKADVDKIPALGQALAAASVPVVLTVAQITTLTPPAAITNYANETGGNLAAIKTDVDKIPSQGQALAASSMPVVLTAAQITTLTPPTNTGYALDATLTGAGAKTQIVDGSGNVIGSISNALKVTATNIGPGTGIGNVGLIAGSALIGKVGIDQTTPGTTNLVALAANQSVNVAQINGVTTLMGNGVTGTGSQRVTIASDNTVLPAVGAGATGSAPPANASYAGLIAKTANPSAASDGNLVGALSDKLGKQVVAGSIRDLKGDAALTLTSTTTETSLIAAVASTFIDLYGLIVANISATATEVVFRDVTAGTARFSIMVPAGETRGFMLPESAAYKQATVNTAWTAQCGTSVASIKISALYVKNI